jgi:uncharacterized protein
VRHHGEIARIEIEREAFGQILSDDAIEKITAALKGLGYIYVCLDLEGYRTGSMNAAWDREQRTRAESRE